MKCQDGDLALASNFACTKVKENYQKSKNDPEAVLPCEVVLAEYDVVFTCTDTSFDITFGSYIANYSLNITNEGIEPISVEVQIQNNVEEPVDIDVNSSDSFTGTVGLQSVPATIFAEVTVNGGNTEVVEATCPAI